MTPFSEVIKRHKTKICTEIQQIQKSLSKIIHAITTKRDESTMCSQHNQALQNL
jgi:hypothetical protein